MDFPIPLTKRHKQYHPVNWGTSHQLATQSPHHEPIPENEDFLTSLFALNESEPRPASGNLAPKSIAHGSDRTRKRTISDVDSDDPSSPEQQAWSRSSSIDSQDTALVKLIPAMFPSVPSMENRIVDLDICNPFIENADRHPHLRKKTIVSEDGKVNGYIKCRIVGSQTERRGQSTLTSSTSRQNTLVVRSTGHVQAQPLPGENIPSLPSGYGSNMKLGFLDVGLWKFYQTAFCTGRTLLQKTNLWLVDFAKMADSNDCVRHALLALAATYVLDYTPDHKWRARANYHYKTATKLLSQALRSPESHEIGKEDAVVGALVLLSCEDIITWEMRRPKELMQRWVEGVRSAIQILDDTDPGYRYWNPVNVQSSDTRIANANLVASFEIIAQPVIPLKFDASSSTYTWLLEGSERDTRKIHGGTGVCPRLLHMFAQITRCAAEMVEKPNCIVIPQGAAYIEKRLADFRQWSDLSEGYPSAKDLLNSCCLDARGQVSTAAEVTDLTGQAWVSAAQIYLQCRFYKRPRSYPAVKEHLNILLRCVEKMPCTGKLFTSQSPFFPIFIMGVVSYQEEDRKVARDWFDTVLLGAGCRSSVPPVWDALKALWVWIDTNLDEDPAEFDGPIEQRKPWWEQMVGRLMSTCGPLSLC